MPYIDPTTGKLVIQNTSGLNTIPVVNTYQPNQREPALASGGYAGPGALKDLPYVQLAGSQTPEAEFNLTGYQPYQATTTTGPTAAEMTAQSLGAGGFRTVGGSTPLRPIGSTQTTTVARTPTGTLPTLGTLPQFQAPAYDESEALKNVPEFMAPIRPLRSALNQVITSANLQENPNVAAFMGESAMKGFSEGLSNIAQRARQDAISAYNQRYNYDYQAALQTWNASNQAKMAEFNAAMQDYANTIKATTTTTQMDIYKKPTTVRGNSSLSSLAMV